MEPNNLRTWGGYQMYPEIIDNINKPSTTKADLAWNPSML